MHLQFDQPRQRQSTLVQMSVKCRPAVRCLPTLHQLPSQARVGSSPQRTCRKNKKMTHKGLALPLWVLSFCLFACLLAFSFAFSFLLNLTLITALTKTLASSTLWWADFKVELEARWILGLQGIYFLYPKRPMRCPLACAHLLWVHRYAGPASGAGVMTRIC